MEKRDNDKKPGRRYAAFISYSHADEAFSDWLHSRLETYQIPKTFVGGDGPEGPIGKRLGKVFRDREELSAGHDLGEEIKKALKASDALIVLCSPRSSGSRYVEEEICYFKSLGKQNRIFAAIIGGEPHAAGKPGYSAADECFPRALIYQNDLNGKVSNAPETSEPLAADFREGRDGKENGSLKVIAALLGVGLDELVQREKQAERRRRRRANALASAMATLAIAALAGGAFAWVKQNEAELSANDALRQKGLADVSAAEAVKQRNVAVAAADAERKARDEEALQRALAQAKSMEARATLLRFFATRAEEQFRKNELLVTARYALAGQRLAAREGISGADLEDYRTWLAAAMHRRVDSTPMEFPRERIEASAWTAQGPRVLTSDKDDVLRLRSAPGAPVLATMRGHTDVVLKAAISPNGTRIVSMDSVDKPGTFDSDQNIRVWNATSGAQIYTLKETDYPGAPVFSPDSRRFAYYIDNKVFVRDADRQDEPTVFGGVGDDILQIKFSPDGALLAAGGVDAKIRVWNLASGEQTAEISTRGSVQSLAFSPDGKVIVAQSARNGVKEWDAQSGEKVIDLAGPSREFTQLAFSPDGKTIIGASDGHWGQGNINVFEWDAKTGGALNSMQGHSLEVNAVAFSPDGKRILSTANDETARIWVHEPQREVMLLSGHENGAGFIRYSADGRQIVTSDAAAIRFWNASTGAPSQHPLKGPSVLYALAPSPDWTRIVTVGNPAAFVALVRDARTGATVLTLSGHRGDILAATYSPDGARIATAARDGTAGVWDARTGKLIFALEGAKIDVLAVAFSPDGTLIATGSGRFGEADPFDMKDNAVRLYDAKTGRLLHTMQGQNSNTITDVVFSPDGRRIASTGRDGIVRVWDTQKGASVIAIVVGQQPLRRALFSPDGARLFTAGADGRVMIYDLASGRSLGGFSGFPNGVADMALSPGGGRLAVSSTTSTTSANRGMNWRKTRARHC